MGETEGCAALLKMEDMEAKGGREQPSQVFLKIQRNDPLSTDTYIFRPLV